MVATVDAELLRERVVAARTWFQGGDPHRAATEYERLRDLLSDGYDGHPDAGSLRACHVRVLLGLAAARFETAGGLDSSLELLAEAERLPAAEAEVELVATVRGQRGLLLLRAGRPDEAMVALDDAVALIDAAAPYDQMMMLLNRAVLRMDRGSVPAACEDLERCVELAARHGERDLEMRARHNLGWAEFLRGRIPRALADMGSAAALREDPHPIAMLDQARTLREAGLLAEAERLLADAEQLFERGHLSQDVAETRLTLAETALAGGDPGRALPLARAAEATFAARQNLRWRRRAQLLVLRCRSRAGASAGDLAAVADEAAELATACREEHRLDLVRPAELLALECGLRAGRPVHDPPAVRSGDPLETRLQVREIRSLAAAAGGDVARATTEVHRGLAELGAYQGSFGSLDLRTAAAVHGLPLARLGLDLADRTGSPAALFAAVERGRAISSRLAGVAPPSDERTAALLTELRRTQERLREVSGDAAAVAELRRLRTRAARLQSDIRARAWEVEGVGSARARASAGVSVVRREAARQGTSFVSYVLHRDRWRAVVATGARPTTVDLAAATTVSELVQRVRADLDALAMPRLPDPLAAAVTESLHTGLRRLDELLVAPLRLPHLPLVVSCSAALAVLPWSMLPSRRGLPVVVAPGASAWLRAAAGGARPAGVRAVVVAGPGLHRAAEEAEQVRACWPGSSLLAGEGATTAAVATALERADLVHVAAHGTHQPESPLFSSLRLTDGPLYAYELDAEEETAGCVVLSACEAGLSTVRPGDEALGLTNVLLHLGSRSVLAGVARVRDDVAETVMARVHALLAAGHDSARALAQALAEEEQPAPFVAFGASW